MMKARAAARLEDLTFLADHGVGFIEAAERVGTTRAALQKWLIRYNATALMDRLRAHDPAEVDSPDQSWAAACAHAKRREKAAA